ncbi:MAG: DnaJ domain-containing protein [Alphaproteobacteria bacterium]
MPYLLLVIGLLIGAYALYRFFLNATVAQIKALFLLAIITVLCAALFTLAVTGRLPAAIALLGAVVPFGIGFLRARKQERGEAPGSGGRKDIQTREEALDILGLEDGASAEDIKAAYKRLMQKIHPDHEGSEWMAAKLNQARDVLLGK